MLNVFFFFFLLLLFLILFFFFFFWHYNPWRTLIFPKLSSNIRLKILEVFQQNTFFLGWACQPYAQQPTWRTRVSLFVRVITFVPSGTGGPAGSYDIASIALRIVGPRKPHHFINVGIPSGGLIR